MSYFKHSVFLLPFLAVLARALPRGSGAPALLSSDLPEALTRGWPGEPSSDEPDSLADIALIGLPWADHQDGQIDTQDDPVPPADPLPGPETPSRAPARPMDALLLALRTTLSDLELVGKEVRAMSGPARTHEPYERWRGARHLALRRQLLSFEPSPPHTPAYPGVTPDENGYYDAAPDDELPLLSWH